jgi:HEAT repeat protein
MLGDQVESVRSSAVDRLIEAVQEPGFRTQLGAIAALGVLRSPKALALLTRIHRTAPDGRTRRSAYDAMVCIREGRTTEKGLAGLRRRVEELAEENQGLRVRLDKLERP